MATYDINSDRTIGLNIPHWAYYIPIIGLAYIVYKQIGSSILV